MTGRTPSETEWLRVNAYCQRERHELAVRAAGGYPPGLRLAGTPLLAPPAWRLPAPVPLDGVRLEFRPDAPRPDVPDLAALVPAALPVRGDGSRYRRYSDVIAELAAPSVFENRPTYRLIEADLAGAGRTAADVRARPVLRQRRHRRRGRPRVRRRPARRDRGHPRVRAQFAETAATGHRGTRQAPAPRRPVRTGSPSAARRASPGARQRSR